MDNEKIKKALKCCSDEKLYHCESCPRDGIEKQHNVCEAQLAKEALEFINALESENAKLKQHKRELEGGQKDLLRVIKEFNIENEKLKNRITCQVVIPDDKLEEIKKECLEKIEVDKDKLLKQFAEVIKMFLKIIDLKTNILRKTSQMATYGK